MPAAPFKLASHGGQLARASLKQQQSSRAASDAPPASGMRVAAAVALPAPLLQCKARSAPGMCEFGSGIPAMRPPSFLGFKGEEIGGGGGCFVGGGTTEAVLTPNPSKLQASIAAPASSKEGTVRATDIKAACKAADAAAAVAAEPATVAAAAAAAAAPAAAATAAAAGAAAGVTGMKSGKEEVESMAMVDKQGGEAGPQATYTRNGDGHRSPRAVPATTSAAEAAAAAAALLSPHARRVHWRQRRRRYPSGSVVPMPPGLTEEAWNKLRCVSKRGAIDGQTNGRPTQPACCAAHCVCLPSIGPSCKGA
jgi:hypothetical protein